MATPPGQMMNSALSYKSSSYRLLSQEATVPLAWGLAGSDLGLATYAHVQPLLLSTACARREEETLAGKSGEEKAIREAKENEMEASNRG